MTLRERFTAVLAGRTHDRIPMVSRMDIRHTRRPGALQCLDADISDNVGVSDNFMPAALCRRIAHVAQRAAEIRP